MPKSCDKKYFRDQKLMRLNFIWIKIEIWKIYRYKILFNHSKTKFEKIIGIKPYLTIYLNGTLQVNGWIDPFQLVGLGEIQNFQKRKRRC
jgi:hypothetical protein